MCQSTKGHPGHQERQPPGHSYSSFCFSPVWFPPYPVSAEFSVRLAGCWGWVTEVDIGFLDPSWPPQGKQLFSMCSQPQFSAMPYIKKKQRSQSELSWINTSESVSQKELFLLSVYYWLLCVVIEIWLMYCLSAMSIYDMSRLNVL